MSSPARHDSQGSRAIPGERFIISHIRSRLPPAPASLIVAAGDDAAVAVPERGALQVLTTDALVEGVHFDRRFSSLADVGYKAIAVNVSDVAAMGGTSSLVLLSLMLPDGTSIQEIDVLLDGVLEMARIAKVTVAGGNITRSPGALIVDVTATGHVRPRRILRRDGGRPGDALFVTGSIGGASAGLEWLTEAFRCGFPLQPEDGGLATCVQRHRRPEPRLRIGAVLGRARVASACMDLSDGLADAVRQIAEASGTGARIDAAALPIDAAAHKWFSASGHDPVGAALSGGDDYELLFTLPRKTARRLRSAEAAARGVPLTHIGELTTEPELVVVRDGQSEPLPSGFTHF
ncbi:MAG: thiamine-phosphate kinase [Acidobacteria bacterium]|nr:thiamine-phosphate kinase [Acidobacteriota bacterium]